MLDGWRVAGPTAQRGMPYCQCAACCKQLKLAACLAAGQPRPGGAGHAAARVAVGLGLCHQRPGQRSWAGTGRRWGWRWRWQRVCRLAARGQGVAGQRHQANAAQALSLQLAKLLRRWTGGGRAGGCVSDGCRRVKGRVDEAAANPPIHPWPSDRLLTNSCQVCALLTLLGFHTVPGWYCTSRTSRLSSSVLG